MMMIKFKVRGSRFEEECPLPQGEQGYMLLGLIVAIFIITLALGVAASKAAFAIRREREVETVRRGNQYVRAIREYYVKYQHYPGSLEQLEKTNNIRFLRKRYIDPITGKDDWRLIAVGQNKTTVKGFFGEELQGPPSAGLGSAAGLQSSGLGGTAATTAVSGSGAISGGGAATAAGGAGGASGTQAGSSGIPGAPGAAGGAGGTGTAGMFGDQGLGASTGPIMGVGMNATGNSLVVLNGQTTYQTWEFLYDPRVELLKVKQAMNSGLGSSGTSGMGQTPGSFGQTPGGFGQTPGGGFGPQPGGTTPNSPAGTGSAPGGFSTQP